MDGSLTAVTVAVRVWHHRCVQALQSSEVEEVARGLPVGLTRSKLDLRTVAAKPVGVGGGARMEKGESRYGESITIVKLCVCVCVYLLYT